MEIDSVEVSTTAASKAMRYLSVHELKDKVKQKARNAEKIDPETYRFFTDTRRDPTTDKRHKVAVLFKTEGNKAVVITQKKKTHAHNTR